VCYRHRRAIPGEIAERRTNAKMKKLIEIQSRYVVSLSSHPISFGRTLSMNVGGPSLRESNRAANPDRIDSTYPKLGDEDVIDPPHAFFASVEF